MASVTEYLTQLQTLTKKNLEILEMINESFFTKHTHLSVNIDNSSYIIPSFVALENKINILEENFYNLVHSPETGQAYFHVDGNTRSITVNGYNHTPQELKLNTVSSFNTYQNDIFKDFLTPVPYITFDLKAIPNDIVKVNVKKIIPKNQDLIALFKSLLSSDSSTPSKPYLYSEMYKILSPYDEDKDYIEYDTIRPLPIRKGIGTSTYVIEKIIEDVVDENLDNYITLKIKSDNEDSLYNNQLTYKLFDQTIEKPLSPSDILINNDGTGKMEIVEVYPNTNTIKVKVLNGDFLNLLPTSQYDVDGGGVSDLSKIKFFSTIDFDDDKYINIPLEEDQYIYIAIAPLNDRMNLQAPWGEGVLIDTFSLVNSDNQRFKSYYDENVRNIGDILYEITSMMNNTLTQFTPDIFNEMTSVVPVINTGDISVVQINKHLNDSTTVKNIKSLYSQKKRYNSELNEVQAKIDDINNKLNNISFDDTYGLRTGYTAQLSEYNNKKSEIVTALTKIISEISTNVNNSDVPIENAKYRIRGFFDVEEFISSTSLGYLKDHICGVQVQYRYKTRNSKQGNAVSMTKGFIFSDWNNMNGFINKKQAKIKDDKYIFSLPESNNTVNEPSFNQIDIPISQGETVDIRLRVIYDYGQPFCQVTSSWSEIVNIEFPDEFLKDVQVLDIIEENNNDIEMNRFSDILNNRGVNDHINDKVIDQDKTYYHNPDNISSGFYTTERRVIPLKDKLLSIDNLLTKIQDDIMGSSAEAVSISMINGDIVNNILPFQTNNIGVQPYNTFAGTGSGVQSETDSLIADGTYTYDSSTGVVSTLINIVISNTSSHTVKLYSMFPGNRDNTLNRLTNYKYDIDDYAKKGDTEKGVWIKCQSGDGSDNTSMNLQTCNQYITFRIKDVNTGEPFYTDSIDVFNTEMISMLKDYTSMKSGVIPDNGATTYPFVKDRKSLCLDSDSTNSYYTIEAGQSIKIPMMFEYKLKSMSSVSKTISFDLRLSLYNDPINYTVKITAKNSQTSSDKLSNANRDIKYLQKINSKYNTTVVK